MNYRIINHAFFLKGLGTMGQQQANYYFTYDQLFFSVPSLALTALCTPKLRCQRFSLKHIINDIFVLTVLHFLQCIDLDIGL